jgi:hypothetical protein
MVQALFHPVWREPDSYNRAIMATVRSRQTWRAKAETIRPSGEGLGCASQKLTDNTVKPRPCADDLSWR